MIKKYDYLIVGSGFFGSVFANLATQSGKKCLIIDKRNHIGGNSFTKEIENINVHQYGPHIFHTNDERIWKYINQFANFKQFTYSPVANFSGELYSLPFNMWTFHQLWGVKTPEEAVLKINESRVPCENPKNIEEYVLSVLGRDVYEKLIYGYTKKQWQKEPKDLPSFIIKRLPFRLTYDSRYYDDRFCGIPEGGYTKIFQNLLAGSDVELSVDYSKDKDYWESKASKIVYTGKIDEFFEYQYGDLEYRSLRFDHEILETENYQGVPVVNWTSEKVPHTRTIESKHFEHSKSSKTVLTTETPTLWTREEVPYYPINNDRNNETYQKYKNLQKEFGKHIFGGRMARYKYYDMDQVIASAIKQFEKESSSR